MIQKSRTSRIFLTLNLEALNRITGNSFCSPYYQGFRAGFFEKYGSESVLNIRIQKSTRIRIRNRVYFLQNPLYLWQYPSGRSHTLSPTDFQQCSIFTGFCEQILKLVSTNHFVCTLYLWIYVYMCYVCMDIKYLNLIKFNFVCEKRFLE